MSQDLREGSRSARAMGVGGLPLVPELGDCLLLPFRNEDRVEAESP